MITQCYLSFPHLLLTSLYSTFSPSLSSSSPLFSSLPLSLSHSSSLVSTTSLSLPGEWTAPGSHGDSPAPTSNFSLTPVDEKRAVMFGGTVRAQPRSDMLHIMHWDSLVIVWHYIYKCILCIVELYMILCMYYAYMCMYLHVYVYAVCFSSFFTG